MKDFRLLILALTLATGASLAAAPADDVAIEQVEKTASSGDRDAMHALCYRYKYGINAPRDLQAALRWCSVAAVLGVDSSQVLLAELFHEGEVVPEDHARALHWYEAAAAQGHPHALLMLFYIYDSGQGVAQDHARAMGYLEKAVAAGYDKAIEEFARQRKIPRGAI